MNRKRSQKWYLKNEKEVMKSLGLTPTKGSGSGFVEKEDGYNDFILSQLKSTDKESIRVSLRDIRKLKVHATQERKLPLFLIQFIQEDEVYGLVRVGELKEVARHLDIKRLNSNNKYSLFEDIDVEVRIKGNISRISSSKKGREDYWERIEKEMEEKNEKRKK